MKIQLKESLFNLRIKSKEGWILFNTFSGKMIHFPAKAGGALLSADSVRNKMMLENGFLIPKRTTIDQEFSDVYQGARSPSDCLYMVLTITTKCDLSCSYCFENRQNRLSMSSEKLKETLSWMDKKLSTGDFNDFYLIVFGGEPLLEVPKVEKFLTETEKICKRRGIRRLPVLLTTNALCENRASFYRLKRCGVECMQVSFDGSRHFTNKRRKPRNLNYRDVYGKTLRILPFLSKNFQITIKLNFSPETTPSVPEFFDDLINLKGLNKNNIKVKPETIMVSWPESLSQKNKDVFHSGDKNLADAFSFICREANKRDLYIDTSGFFSTPCMAFKETSILVEPDGSKRSCICAFGIEEFQINSSVQNSSAHLNKSLKDLKKCINSRCPYFPMCIGGCPYEKLLMNGSIKGILCRREYFEKVLPAFVNQQWLNSSYKLSLF